MTSGGFDCGRRRLFAWLPWLAGSAVVFVGFRIPLSSGLRYTLADLADPRLVNYVLEHGFRWASRHALHQSFWNPPVYYPVPNVSATTDFLLGFAPPYWAFRVLGAAPDTAFQLWLAAISALNFVATYLLARRGLGVGIPAATLAGLLGVLFMSRHVASHPQLAPIFYVLLGILALIRALENRERRGPRRAWIACFFACCALQVWGAVYPFFFFGLLLSLTALAALASRTRRAALIDALRVDATAWVVGVAVLLLAMTPLLYRYGLTAQELGLSAYRGELVPRPMEWILTGRQSLLFGWLQESGGAFDAYWRGRGVGWLPLLAAGIGFGVARRRMLVQTLLPGVALIVLLGTSYGGFSPWSWVHQLVPGAGAIRYPQRLPSVLVPAVLIGFAFFCDGCVRSRRWLLLALLATGCLAERYVQTPYIDKLFVRDYIHEIAERVRPDGGAFLLVPQRPDPLFVADVAGWVSLDADLPTLNGRYGRVPRGYERIQRLLDTPGTPVPELRRAIRAWLQVHGRASEPFQIVRYAPLTRAEALRHRP